MLTPNERRRYARAAERQRIEVERRVVSYVTQTWAGLGSWRDADVDRFVDLVTPRVQAGQVAVASVTDAYLARVLDADGVAVGAIEVANLRGTDVRDVYTRPSKTMRTALSEGKAFPTALSESVNRAKSLVATDMQLANVRQSQATMSMSRASGFKRTLTGRENCALCYIASTQRYRRGDLLPIHPGCDCGVEPLARGEGVDQVIDPDRLEQTHNWVESYAGTSDSGARELGRDNPRSDYLDLIATSEHGEYGPTLRWRDQDFTGPGQI